MIRFNSHNHYDNCEGCKAIRAEALEEAARLFEAKATELRKSNYPPTHLAAYEYDGHADSIRALAGQPSGDAKGK